MEAPPSSVVTTNHLCDLASFPDVMWRIHRGSETRDTPPRYNQPDTLTHAPEAMEETLDYEELKDKAHQLAKDGPTYEELAKELDVSRSAVAQAVTTAGPKLHRLQIRIVEHLSDSEVEEAFRLRSTD